MVAGSHIYIHLIFLSKKHRDLPVQYGSLNVYIQIRVGGGGKTKYKQAKLINHVLASVVSGPFWQMALTFVPAAVLHSRFLYHTPV